MGNNVCGACGYCSSDSHLLACVCFCCGMPCVLKLVIVIVIVLMFMLMLVLIATYLTLASLTLPSVVAFPFPQTLYRKRHFSDGPPILVACRLPSLPERCTSLHRFVAALGKLCSSWPCQNSGSSTSPAGKTRESVSHTVLTPHAVVTIVRPFPHPVSRSQTTATLHMGGGRICPRGHMNC